MSITNTKGWLLLIATALFFAGCAAQIQQEEMARARVLANGDERLAALYYIQMEQNRVNAIMQMSQGLQNAGAIYAQAAHTEIPPVSVPQFQNVPITPSATPQRPVFIPTSH